MIYRSQCSYQRAENGWWMVDIKIYGSASTVAVPSEATSSHAEVRNPRRLMWRVSTSQVPLRLFIY